jgi:hypothetical protein
MKKGMPEPARYLPHPVMRQALLPHMGRNFFARGSIDRENMLQNSQLPNVVTRGGRAMTHNPPSPAVNGKPGAHRLNSKFALEE